MVWYGRSVPFVPALLGTALASSCRALRAREACMHGNGLTQSGPRGRSRRRKPTAAAAAMPDRLDERTLLAVLTSFKKGDFSARLPLEWTGLAGRISDTLNDVIERNQSMALELERLSRVVGKEGRLDERATLREFSGSWAHAVRCVN